MAPRIKQTRYDGISPFQDEGLVWVNNSGFILKGTAQIPLATKPGLLFGYDALYCEPTLCHRVIHGEEFPLTAPEILEVREFITYTLSNPIAIDGVDAQGKFIENATLDKITRTVATKPPSYGVWRLLMDSYPDTWIRVYPVNSDGLILDTEDEAIQIIKTPPPSEDNWWRWEGDWTDGRTVEELQDAKIFEAKSVLLDQIENSTVTVEISNTTYTFGCDDETLNNITNTTSMKPDATGWYPKGAVDPVSLQPNQIKQIGKAIVEKREELYGAYFSKKKAIKQLTDKEQIKIYKVS